MNTNYSENLPECAHTQALLAEYTENSLSARQMWEVEGHLAQCAECAQISREMQSTVALLRSAVRRDTSDDFMARLHSRLDELEPEAVRAPSLGMQLRDWLTNAGHTLRSARIPALSLGVAATAVIAFLIVPRPQPVTATNAPVKSSAPVTQIAAEPLRHNAALAAANPFDDPVAAILDSHPDANEAETSRQEN